MGMMDRCEKIISALERAKRESEEYAQDKIIVPFRELNIILEMLKEQTTTSTNESRIFHCKKCGYGIDDIFLSDEHNYQIKPCFCPNCGRVVK